MKLPSPFEFIQIDVERHLHEYLHVPASEIRQIVIVGTHEGDEIERLLLTYPNTRFLCFEPNPNTYQGLVRKREKLPVISLSPCALSDKPGTARFYELDMPGNGSLLEPDVSSWARSLHRTGSNVGTYEVKVSTLDREAAHLPAIDLLWMDVQGGEGKVLDGGNETLEKVKAIFIEVALVRSPYKGSPLFREIAARLEARNFMCVGLGADGFNGYGNALFVKGFEHLAEV